MREKGKREGAEGSGLLLHSSFPMLVLALLISLAALSAAVYAAFVGNGSEKGVLVHRSLQFNSNILQEYSNKPDYEYLTTGESIVYIRNYNQSNLERNHFDVTYLVTCRLENPNVTDRYYVERDGQPKRNITGDAPVTFTDILYGDTVDTNSFSLSFENADGSVSDTSQTAVIVTVEPSKPIFMRSHKLGAVVRKNSSAFTAEGTFAELTVGATQTDMLAGFLYRVSCTGVAKAGETIQLTWNANMLTLDPYSVLFSDGNVRITDVTGDAQRVGWKTATIPPEEAYRYFYVSFYRTDKWPATDPGAEILDWVKVSSHTDG